MNRFAKTCSAERLDLRPVQCFQRNRCVVVTGIAWSAKLTFFAQWYAKFESSRDVTAARLGHWVASVNRGAEKPFLLNVSSLEGFLWSFAVSFESNQGFIKELSHFGYIHVAKENVDAL